MEYVVLLMLLWFVSLPVVLVYWWKKRKAKNSAGINFETDQNYLSVSRKKNYADYASIGLFLLTNICGIFLAKDVAITFAVFLWAGSLIAFIIYWWKKRSARLSAGENYSENEIYKKISMKKRIVGVASVIFFALSVQFANNPEWIMTEEEKVAYAEKEKIYQQEKLAAEKKAEEERIAAEKKAEEERLAAEKKAAEEKLAAEKKAEEEKLAAEKKAEEEKLVAEKKVQEEKLAAEKKAEEERLAAEKKAQQEAENQRRKEQIKEYAGKAKDYLSEKAEDLTSAGIEKIKQEAKSFTANEIFVSRQVDDLGSVDIYVLPKTVEPLMDGIIFETREGFKVKVQVKINGADAYLQKYYFYNNNNFLESEDKVYFSKWDQDYYGNEESFHGDGRQYHITESSTALEIYRASKKFSLLK